jgi:translation elongation factor EF-Tu-like GTPase
MQTALLLAIEDVPEPRSAVGWVLRGRLRVGDEVEVVGVEPVEEPARGALKDSMARSRKQPRAIA